ncbi:MAG: GNAT family N-acetyltransferase [Rhodobacteraceae bacterium]|nr:MAG: GNAT family N-acetyltransferase [Paracoccaceae bacterium]
MSSDPDTPDLPVRVFDPRNWQLVLGQARISLAHSAEDLRAVQRLRALRFRGSETLSDLDRFDPDSLHLLLRRTGPGGAEPGDVIATARMRLHRNAAQLRQGYAAQFYDLTTLATALCPCLEIGRLCIDTAHVQDPDGLRAMLAGISRVALQGEAKLLLGCASFAGADARQHAPALAYLAAHHLGPAGQRPSPKTGCDAVDLASLRVQAAQAGLRQVPKLLRLYLTLGGWVSDHAVVDRELDTVHVFTAVEIAQIPAPLLRSLQGLAQG